MVRKPTNSNIMEYVSKIVKIHWSLSDKTGLESSRGRFYYCHREVTRGTETGRMAWYTRVGRRCHQENSTFSPVQIEDELRVVKTKRKSHLRLPECFKMFRYFLRWCRSRWLEECRNKVCPCEQGDDQEFTCVRRGSLGNENDEGDGPYKKGVHSAGRSSEKNFPERDRWD